MPSSQANKTNISSFLEHMEFGGSKDEEEEERHEETILLDKFPKFCKCGSENHVFYKFAENDLNLIWGRKNYTAKMSKSKYKLSHPFLCLNSIGTLFLQFLFESIFS